VGGFLVILNCNLTSSFHGIFISSLPLFPPNNYIPSNLDHGNIVMSSTESSPPPFKQRCPCSPSQSQESKNENMMPLKNVNILGMKNFCG